MPYSIKQAVVSCVVSLAILTGTAGLAITAEVVEERPLSLGITGSTPSDPKRNPTHLLSFADVQRMVLDMADAPMTRADIDAVTMAHDFNAEDMVAAGLIREESGLFRIDFNLLTVNDQKRILAASARAGDELAEAFLARKEAFEDMARAWPQRHLSNGDLFYAVLGAFSLDWDGLTYTREAGYRAGPTRVGEDFAYTPWAKEEGADISLKGLYWGSHNHIVGDVHFTSFGDHHSLPRAGIPDIFWNSRGTFRSHDEKRSLVRAGGRLLTSYFDEIQGDIGQVLFALKDRALTVPQLSAESGLGDDRLQRILGFLEALEMVRATDQGFESAVVVLDIGDRQMIDDMLALGREIMADWHGQHYANIRTALSDLTPTRNGVPFEVVYTEVWHFVFGIANHRLAQAGFFADPYAPTRTHQGFIPFLFVEGLEEFVP